jgi:hypothetical protein
VDYKEDEKGKCRSCGFLAKHGLPGMNLPSPRFFEVDPLERRAVFFTHLFNHSLIYRNSFKTELVCFVGRADLMAELACLLEESEAIMLNARALLDRDRQCKGWYPFTPGFDPSEHLAELRRQQLEDDRRRFEEGLSKRAEDLQTALASREEESQSRTSRLMTRLTVLAVALAAVQILTGLTSDSLAWKGIVKLWHSVFR